MSKILFRLILICVSILLIALMVSAWWRMREIEPLVTSLEPVPVLEESEVESETISLFTFDEGARASFASNPLVLAQDDSSLTLAYEYRSDELKNSPQEKVRVMTTTDGLVFTDENPVDWRIAPTALQFPDGTYRRYIMNPQEGGVVSMSSVDGITFTQDDGIRYAVETDSRNTQHTFGVSTFFLDSKGGVVLLYNSTINNHVVVNRAYASPETNGMTFVFDRSDVLEGTLPSDDYADPHTLVRANGDIWLIIMNQETGKRPQKDQVGTIHAYISHDDGVTFDYEGQLIAWSDWKKDEVRSLNDPKLVEFPEGTLRIYFAAWIPDETMEEGFRWDLLSAHN